MPHQHAQHGQVPKCVEVRHYSQQVPIHQRMDRISSPKILPATRCHGHSQRSSSGFTSCSCIAQKFAPPYLWIFQCRQGHLEPCHLIVGKILTQRCSRQACLQHWWRLQNPPETCKQSMYHHLTSQAHQMTKTRQQESHAHMCSWQACMPTSTEYLHVCIASAAKL